MSRPSRTHRHLSFENLHKRELLAADLGVSPDAPESGFEAPPAPVAQATAQNPIVIESVTLRINGVMRTVYDDLSTVELEAGDHLEVVGVQYQVHGSMDGHAGVIALEGHLNRLYADAPSTTDYSDGRYSTRESNPTLATGEGSHEGLAEGWDVTAGGNRLSLTLVMYDATGATVADQHYVKLQVGQPDFEVDESVIENLSRQQIREGQEFRIAGSWTNHGEGRYHNYAEVDVYHASNLSEPEWVGVLAGVSGPAESVTGEFTNPHGHYSNTWTPAQSGDYVFKFYADPENLWNESVEANNLVTMKINVLPPPALDGGSIDVKNVNARAGQFKSLQINVNTDDQEGTELYHVVLRDVPSYVTLSAGERVGDDWVLQIDELDKLEILADTNSKKTVKLELTAALVYTEPSTGETAETMGTIKMMIRK